MKGWWNVIYLKLKCAAFVLKLEKAWYTYFSTALIMAHVRLIWLQVAHCLQTKCNIDFVILPEICILGVLTGQYIEYINSYS